MNKKLKLKKWISLFSLGLLSLSLININSVSLVKANDFGSVVINEIAWAGSIDHNNDEWIELYNTTNRSINLEGWKLKDDGTEVLTFPNLEIPAYGYFLIEDSENAVSNVDADLIFNMSLSNSGDSLELLNSNNQRIDIVNATSGAWYAGNNNTKATMERVDAKLGDLAENFANSIGNGGLASQGSAIIGTPRALNSVSVLAEDLPTIKAVNAGGNLVVGQNFDLVVKVENLINVFAYGIQLNYLPAELELINIEKLNYLNQDGVVETSFQHGLKGGEAGKLIVAEARTSQQEGANGNGDLFKVTFKVLNDQAMVNFDAGSFVSSIEGDLAVNKISFKPEDASELPKIIDLKAALTDQRYEIKLNWNSTSQTVNYFVIERKNALGEFVQIGQTENQEFIDNDLLSNAGKIIPQINYQYRVKAVKLDQSGEYAEVSGLENRGLKGDNNRSDLVDGRDLERLALHFAENTSSPFFDALIDTTYDGVINGSDLIDLGASFAQEYQPN